MDFNAYRRSFFVDPPPEQRFRFRGSFGATMYFEDYRAAIGFYEKVLGPPSYVEGEGTRGWPIAGGWLTLLQGREGNPRNAEITLEVESPEEAEALQRDFILAGAKGQAPSNQLMYRPVRHCPVKDPFGLEILIIAPLTGE